MVEVYRAELSEPSALRTSFVRVDFIGLQLNRCPFQTTNKEVAKRIVEYLHANPKSKINLRRMP
jgi:hypothetical protein